MLVVTIQLVPTWCCYDTPVPWLSSNGGGIVRWGSSSIDITGHPGLGGVFTACSSFISITGIRIIFVIDILLLLGVFFPFEFTALLFLLSSGNAII